MLPNPILTLTIPSLHDDTVLDCRIYSPPNFLAKLKSQTTIWHKKAAIVAHPYAPLGGCYDDPVVDIVACALLHYDFFVGTFNFRGAGSSKGRTSWTAKPEIDDYTSFIGLMVYFMHYLSLPEDLCSNARSVLDENESYNLTPIPSQALPPLHSPTSQKSHVPSAPNLSLTSPPSPCVSFEGNTKNKTVSAESRPLLVLAGYSYGALITTKLPTLSSIVSLFNKPELGTAASEIRLRAQQLAKQQNDLFASIAASLQEKPSNNANELTSKHQLGRSLQANYVLGSHKASAASSVRHGGEETDPDVRRQSHDSQSRPSFSIEPVQLRKSIDRVRSLGRCPNGHTSPTSPQRQDSTPSGQHSLGSISSPSSLDNVLLGEPAEANGGCDESKMDFVGLEDIKVAYLLISPLQGLVTKLATMWTSTSTDKNKDSSSKTQGPTACEVENKLILNDTLAIFGDQDVFTSSKKLRSWAGGLSSVEKSRFRHAEIGGAGHFWHEEGVVDKMRRTVGAFISEL